MSQINTNRNNGIELLRIVGMLLIIAHHYAVHGGFILEPDIISINKAIVQFLSAGGKLGVNCFILITGYFLIKSTFKFEKLLKLIIAIFTYSTSIYIIALLLGHVDFSLKQVIQSFFPVVFNQYWFATSYILLYLLSPYINALINSIGRREHLNLILLLVTIWSFLPTIALANLNFSSIGWFVTLYVIAAYIRLYPNAWFDSSKINMILAFSSYSIVLLSIIIFNFLGLKIGWFGAHSTHLASMNAPPLLFCAITLFLWFKNLKVKNNRYIDVIASSMFGVYLIHDNNIMRPLLWVDVFKNNLFFDSNFLIVHAVIVVILVFSCCIFVDMIKRSILDKLFLRLVTSVFKGYSGNMLNVNPRLCTLAKKVFHQNR